MQSEPPVRRRFIAGANCPRCRRPDLLYVVDRDGRQVCACVECGEIDTLDRDAVGPVPAPGAAGHGVAAVRIIDPAQE